MTAGSHEAVTAVLDALEGRYGPFSIDQTTVTVPPETYEHVRSGTAAVIETGVRVRRGADTLAVRDGTRWSDPTGPVPDSVDIERAARRVVREATGVDCDVIDLRRATILGFVDKSDRDTDPVYRLVALFDGVYRGGETAADAAWRSVPPEPGVGV
jgi:ADP-ribose pyrophosphatase YjhB (NUDIX family)